MRVDAALDNWFWKSFDSVNTKVTPAVATVTNNATAIGE
jgi:hypothetical protein